MRWTSLLQFVTAIALSVAAVLVPAAGSSQTLATKKSSADARNAAVVVQPPSGYVIGADDVLAILFPYEKDLSSEVSVRPDGMISLPLINDIKAAGLTPEQLRMDVIKAVDRFVQEPTVTVVVKEINSRKVFITGKVGKPGVYPLHESMTVLQLIAMAGGLLEYADSKNIVVISAENGKTISRTYNHNEVVKQKNLQQNVELRSGDTVIVP